MDIEAIHILRATTQASKIAHAASKTMPIQHVQKIVTGLEKEIVGFLIKLQIICIIIRYHRNPLKWIHVFKAMDPHRKDVLGQRRIKKIVKVDGKYHWGLFIPAWPSAAFHQFLVTEINRVHPLPVKANRFTNVFMAVTTKCSLKCEHCYAWDELNKKEKLSLMELKKMVATFEREGVAQIHLSGGEPMLRVNDVIELIKSSKKETEFWILTSGLNLTSENARKLKQNGLVGVMISLDHFEPDIHNLFRGSKDAFDWVQQAIQNAIAAELVTTLSICVTRSFITESNLKKYMDLAKKYGVSFVQFLEPKAVGHYEGKDVWLNTEHTDILEPFYLKMNYDPAFKEYPSICYHGFHQRRMGCLAAGNRSLYVDTAGDLHACPFCQAKTGNALTGDLDLSIEQLQSRGCHKYHSVE